MAQMPEKMPYADLRDPSMTTNMAANMKGRQRKYIGIAVGGEDVRI
jgi:hypothetical protein